MKLRSFLTGLAAVVLVLLLVGAGGGYWLVGNSPLKLLRTGGGGEPAATIFVPKQAPAMVSLLVNPDRLESVRLAIAPLGQRKQARAELTQIKQGLLSNLGLEYETDIQPWLGDEITLAVTTADIDRDRQNGRQPGYLLAVATQNPDRAREFLQLFWQKRAIAGTDLIFEQYAGVKIIYANPQPTTSGPAQAERASLATAVVGDRFVLFANYPKVLRDAITNVQAPDLNLSSSSGYQQALRAMPDRQMGLVFANLPQLAVWLGEQFQPEELNGSATVPQRTYEGLVLGLALNAQGLLADTALLAPPGQSLEPAKPQLTQPVAAAKFIPASSPFLAAGVNLHQLWSDMQTGLMGYDTLTALIQQPLTIAQSQWGLESPLEVIDWVQGEYALGVLPRNGSGADWIFATEDSQTVQTALQQLEAIARQQGISTGAITVGDRAATAWTQLELGDRKRNKRSQASLETLQARVRGLYTTTDGYDLFATAVAAMEQVLQPPLKPLVDTANFAQAIAPLNPRNDGYLYIDWVALQEKAKQRIPILRWIDTAANPFVSHLKSFTVTSYGSERTLRRGAVFIRLQ